MRPGLVASRTTQIALLITLMQGCGSQGSNPPPISGTGGSAGGGTGGATTQPGTGGASVALPADDAGVTPAVDAGNPANSDGPGSPGDVATAPETGPAAPGVPNPPGSVVWNIDNLKMIGGQPVSKVVGNPMLIDTPGGKAMQLNGKDAIFVGNMPISGWTKWTAEVIFRPDTGGPGAQRWFHMQGPGGDRVLFELRMNGDTWFLVSFVQCPGGTARAFAVGFPHPAGAWYHVAIVVDGTSLKHYVNGMYENAGPCPGAEGCKTTAMLTTPYPLNSKPIGGGGTSIGCRYTQEAFLKGAVRMARFTPQALTPAEFVPNPTN